MAAHPETWVVGTFDPAIGRTQLLVEGMSAREWPVATCVEPVWGGTPQRVAAARGGLANPRLVWRLARAYATLGLRLRQLRPTPRILLLGYPGQLDAIVLRALFPRAAIILDAFVALDETLADRGLRRDRGLRETGCAHRFWRPTPAIRSSASAPTAKELAGG